MSSGKTAVASTPLTGGNIIPACIAVLLLWADFFLVFRNEWALNEQYSYGFLVPFLTTYLVYRRWLTRPPCGSLRFSWLWTTIFVVCLAALLPLRIILAGSPDWRMALWLYAGCVAGASLCLAGRLGGWPWFKYFALPGCLLLFAVPWPTGVESILVRGLMGLVSAVTVETLNLMGIYAEQQGNIIRLAAGSVGVEEACSGVRSFQSTFMAAFFLGEFFRWRLSWRAGLIIVGCLVSVLLNIGRALTLTLVTVKRGPEAMEVIHDPMGHFVSIAAFLALLGLCALIERLTTPVVDDPSGSEHTVDELLQRKPANFQLGAALVGITLLSSHVAAILWYHSPALSAAEAWHLQPDWTVLPATAEEMEINPAVRAQLRYSEGRQMQWRTGQQRWTAFWFSWDEGRVSSHVGVHRPENCLPSVGIRPVAEYPPFSLSFDGGELQFSATSFDAMGTPLQVFYAVWDRFPSHAVTLGNTARDRLLQAWRGERIRGRYSMQLVVFNEPDAQRAALEARELVAALMRTPAQ